MVLVEVAVSAVLYFRPCYQRPFSSTPALSQFWHPLPQLGLVVQQIPLRCFCEMRPRDDSTPTLVILRKEVLFKARDVNHVEDAAERTYPPPRPALVLVLRDQPQHKSYTRLRNPSQKSPFLSPEWTASNSENNADIVA